MKAFFDAIRPLFGGRISQAQVDGLNALLRGLYGLPLAYQAYLLATAYHETAHTMQPIIERGARAYFSKYEVGTRLGKNLGNAVAGDGFRFRGRGYVQITGRANYARAGRLLAIDLIGNPDAALQEGIASKILAIGCCDGWFTGRRLADYLDRPVPDYRNARRVVNGTDRADQIAGYAVQFEQALKKIDGGIK